MAHESFEDLEVANAVNHSFVPVKVDREERPDVDAVYMAACIAMTGSGGWPLTVLLTPDQKPFWAGTYLPKAQLLSLLTEAARLWREERGMLLSVGDELTLRLRQEDTAGPGAPGRGLVEEAVHFLSQRFDTKWGGFGDAPKFPAAHNLLFLLRYAARTGDGRARQMAEDTLEHIYRGGIFDHVGGGFSRYSTDERWLVPHFEKMLYDNALLALSYTEAYQTTRKPWYEKTIRRTLDYVLDELAGPQGGFCCGQDADSEGVEGKYYVFTPHELTDVLDPKDAGVFCRWFGISRTANFEGKSIPHLIENPEWAQEPEGIEELCRKVRRYRRTRTRLHRDDKILSAWNGLLIAALARAGLVLDEPRYLEAARGAAIFLQSHMMDERNRLMTRWREGESAHPGKLDDYAFYTWGLLELYAATFEVEFLNEAHRMAGLLLELFFDSERGGFYPYASDGEQLITRNKEAYDGAMPSGNAVAALILSRLARMTGEKHWWEAADLQLRWLAGAVRHYPAGHCFTLLVLLEELWPTAELVCAAQKLPADLLDFLRKAPRNGLTVLLKTPQTAFNALAPFTDAYPCPAAGAQYYLCRDKICAQPVKTVEMLEKLLDG